MNLHGYMLWYLLIALCSASPVYMTVEDSTTLPLPSSSIFQFGQKGTWIECAVTRPDGSMLFTTVYPNASLYLLAPSAPLLPQSDALPAEWDVSLVHLFSNITSVEGIAQISSDTYFMVGGNVSEPGYGVPDTWGAWTVTFPPEADEATAPVVTHILDIPGEVFLNGVVPLPAILDAAGAGLSIRTQHEKIDHFRIPSVQNRATMASSVVLVADSLNGAVYGVDITTGTYWLALTVPEMEPLRPIATIPLGINGVKILGKHLYFTNSFASSVYRVSLDQMHLSEESARVKSVRRFRRRGDESNVVSVETVVTVADTFFDDFAFGPGTAEDLDESSTIWLATNPNNTVVAVRPVTVSRELPPASANSSAGLVSNSTITDGDGNKVTISWESIVVAGEQQSLDLAGATSVTFGGTDLDAGFVYATTAGGLADPINRTVSEPAKVVAIDTQTFWA